MVTKPLVLIWNTKTEWKHKYEKKKIVTISNVALKFAYELRLDESNFCLALLQLDAYVGRFQGQDQRYSNEPIKRYLEGGGQ